MNPFADIAVALKIEANDLAERAKNAEITAARIGLSPVATEFLLAERRRQAVLVADAHRLLLNLMPIEQTLRAVISTGEGWR